MLMQDDRVDSAANSYFALYIACREGHVEVVRILLSDPSMNISTYSENFLSVAVGNRDLKMVHLLLQDQRIILPANRRDWIFSLASSTGQVKMVHLLSRYRRVSVFKALNWYFFAICQAVHDRVTRERAVQW